MKSLRLALAQINPTVGDLEGNADKIIHYIGLAREQGAAIVAFPELAITGYPPEDLLLKPRFVSDNLKALDRVREAVQEIVAIVGFVDMREDIYNAAAILSNREVKHVYRKEYLPNYGVFDEFRYFKAGDSCPVYKVGDALMGVSICEDIWYPEGPLREQALRGAEVVISINASPYSMGKWGDRDSLLRTRASDSAVIVAYLNMVGGQDELVFDGGSLVFDECGSLIASAKQFEEELLVVDLDLESVHMRRLHDPRARQQAQAEKQEAEIITIRAEALPEVEKPGPPLLRPLNKALGQPEEEEVYGALMLGLTDYVQKNSFKGVLVGLSGGVDSALVTTLATDALGPDRVTCLFMPSEYTAAESREGSLELSKNLGVKLLELPITGAFDALLSSLGPEFKGAGPGVAEENLQARIRGSMLMAYSNKLNLMVLATGNKSEMSVGYATLYGDMAGGFAVIKDVPKTLVYGLAKWRNEKGPEAPPIPMRILTREPTAELRPGQLDTDSLPPYPELDPILHAYVEEDKSFEEILSLGAEAGRVRDVIRMVDKSEYKRRQSPPGIKITRRAFGRDRRFPMTNRYRSF